jgi:hypothetical protein
LHYSKWENIIKYTFLSDFDLLYHTHQDICQHQLATLAGLLALDMHIKILCGHDEINHLNVEVRRVATHLQDKDQFLCMQEDTINAINPHLAHHIGVYWMVRSWFNSHHIRHLRQIATLHGFTGTVSVGVALKALETPIQAPPLRDDRLRDDDMLASKELLELQEEQEQEEQLDIDLLDILDVSIDRMHLNH